MSLKSRLATAASITFVAMSAMATTSANAFSLFDPPCIQSATKWACGEVTIVPEAQRTRPNHLTHRDDPSKNTDPRFNQAMQDAGGGGGGGGGGGR